LKPTYHLLPETVLLTLLQQIPLEVDTEFLVVKHWPYFYERSIGCIGVLKDWLIRAISATMADNQPKLLFERIAECALPLAQCESMAMEAASGEQELRYTASRRQHLWQLLGMTTETEQQQAEPAPPTTPPQHGHPSGGLHVGEPKPQRYEVGERKKEEQAEKCSFSNQTIALSPAQLAQAGVAKCQCPLCGAIWTARIRGEVVSFPPHQPPQKARASSIPRWVRQGTVWTRA
jgi:hypothetical protein